VEAIALWLVSVVHGMGYPGIFILMFFSNALIPVPIEVIMIPAGYLVQQGQMNFFMLITCGVVGDISGSLFAYYVALHLGRRVLLAYGKHVFFDVKKMEMLDRFFAGHGEISVLTGRLVPGLRHFMAFPAGLSHMNVKKFALYTGVGGGVWMCVLIGVGYVIGGNRAMIRHYMPLITASVVAAVGIMIVLYIIRHRRRKPEKPDVPV